MKRLSWRLSLLVAFAGLAVLGSTSTGLAQDENRDRGGDRFDRLERRLNELAERQENFMRQMGSAQDRRQPGAMPGGGPNPGQQPGGFNPPAPRPGMGPRGPEGMGGPGMGNPGMGQQDMGPLGMNNPMALQGRPGPMILKCIQAAHKVMRVLFLVGIVLNILMATWIYQDIRKRGQGSGIFVAAALLAGIPATLIYALVRIADNLNPLAAEVVTVSGPPRGAEASKGSTTPTPPG